MNRNAHIGRNVEVLFRNSIGDNPSIIRKIQGYFKINSRFLNAVCTGIHAEKADVKMEFADGHNVDANIKAFKKSGISYNQLTRTSLLNFCKRFSLDGLYPELQELFISKARNVKCKLFTEDKQKKFLTVFEGLAENILEWSFSYKKSREILVLYERNNSTMYIYPMKEVFKNLDKAVSFTRNGNIAIGKSIVIQRKGGNGVLSKDIPKDSIKHPGNNIQIKLKMNEFIKEMQGVLLATYVI